MRFFLKLTTAIAALTFTLPALAYASLTSGACATLSQSERDNNAVCGQGVQTVNPVIHVFHVTADIFALLAGIAAVILIIASGVTMITSGGNSEAVGNARKRIFNAVIGLAVIAFAWTIITFAIDKLIK